MSPSEYESIIIIILDIFLETFDITLERLGYNTWMDSQWLKQLFNLNTSYPVNARDRRPEDLILGKAFMEAKAVANEAKIMTSETSPSQEQVPFNLPQTISR